LRRELELIKVCSLYGLRLISLHLFAIWKYNNIRHEVYFMSIFMKMDWPSRILIAAGIFCIIWGYLGTLLKGIYPGPMDFISIGLGTMGIALAYYTIKPERNRLRCHRHRK
jgi:hypothetical protein